MPAQALAPFATSLIASAGSALAGSASASLSKRLESAAAAAEHAKSKDRTRKTADDFERMFLEQTMDRVNNSEGTDGPLGENGTGGGIYRSMMNKEYANAIVKSGGIGISDQVYKQMLAMQGASDAARG
jgi:peptidoglycan hydrolase FlgJ